MRISIKGWWTWRDLTAKEAEAYHYRCAAKCAENGDRSGVQEHLIEARRNYQEALRILEELDAEYT